MIRRLCILVLLFASITPARAAPQLRLEASTARSEFTAGDRFTVSAHLFNDGIVLQDGSITIAAPAGFVALSPEQTSGQIAPGRALGASFSYQVAATAPKGLARFVVIGGGQVQIVTIRVGPIVAPPARGYVWRVYLPAVR